MAVKRNRTRDVCPYRIGRVQLSPVHRENPTDDHPFTFRHFSTFFGFSVRANKRARCEFPQFKAYALERAYSYGRA